MPRKAAIEESLPVELQFDLALREGNRKKPIYELHKWWARRLGSCFRLLMLGATMPATQIRELEDGAFYRTHDLNGLIVFDPFMGGGTSLIEATKLNAKVIGVDIDPVACFISEKELQSISESRLLAAYEQVMESCASRILKRYETQMPDGRCGIIKHAFWVELVPCVHCGYKVEAHPHYKLAWDRDKKSQIVFCATCGTIAQIPYAWASYRCKRCTSRTHLDEGPIQASVLHCGRCKARTKLKDIPPAPHSQRWHLFALEVEIDEEGTLAFKSADDGDRAAYAKAAADFDQRSGELLIPSATIPAEGRSDRRPISFGHTTYASLFNKRQLLSLGEIASSISLIGDEDARGFLALALSDSLAANNMLCAYAFGYRRLTPLFALHGYRRIIRPVENNVWGVRGGRGSFSKCFFKLVRGKRYARRPYELKYGKHGHQQIFTGESIEAHRVDRFEALERAEGRAALILNESSEDLPGIPDESVDLILTDPPYYDNLPYSELSDFFHVWVREILDGGYIGSARDHTPILESLYPSRGSQKSGEDKVERFRRRLTQAFKECRRIIKSSGLLVLTYHHRRKEAWASLATALSLNHFRVTNVVPVRSEGRSGFHNYEGSLKWDAVICARPVRRSLRRKMNLMAARRDALEEAQEWQRRLARRGRGMKPADVESLARAMLVRKLTCLSLTESEILRAFELVDPARGGV